MMFIFIKMIRLCLIAELFFCVLSSAIRLGPFAIYTDSTSAIPILDESTTTSTFNNSENSRILSSDDTQNSGFIYYLKEYVLPILYFFSFTSSSLYFSFKCYRLFHTHCKYKRFTFVRRTPKEVAAVRFHDRVVEMDPLNHAVVDVYHDAQSTTETV